MQIWGVARRPSPSGPELLAGELSGLCRALAIEKAALWTPDEERSRLLLAATVGAYPAPGPVAELPLPPPPTSGPSLTRLSLTVEGRLVGVLDLPAGTLRGRPEDETAALVEAAAMAIERARLRRAERRFRLSADHARRHLALVAAAGAALETPRDDPDLVLGAVADVLVPAFADWCAIDVPEAGGVRRLTWTTAPSVDASQVEALHGGHAQWAQPVLRTLATGQSELLVLTASGTFLPEDADAVAVARGLGLDSVLVVPVRLRGLTVAVITCGIAPPRRGYRPSDGEAAEEVAGRVAAAVGRALLYREIQGQADRASERAAQLRRLMEAALAVHARHTLDEVLAVVAEQARRVLGAAAGIASLPSERTGLFSISGGAEQGEGQEADAALLERVGAMARVPGGGDLGTDSAGILSAALTDVTGAVIGAVAVVARQDGADFSDDDESLLVSLAQMASVAIGSARLYELEEQLSRTRRMEAVGRLAGGVAHDLNNLLTVVLGHSHLLLRALGADEQARESVEAIRVAGERAANLSAQLLTISRGHQVEPELIDVSAALRAMDSVLRPLLPEDIELDLRPGSAVGLVLIGTGQLEQILLNLVVNARDAMSTGGRVSVTATAEAGAIVVVVADTGGGMPPEILEHCFEPFVSTKQGVSAGLGLATVYAIVTQAGGEVSVASTEGVGTSVSLRFPRGRGHVAAGSTGTEEVTAGQERVLLVEDDSSVRMLARRVLEEEGYSVIETSSASEALAVTRAGTPFDLLLTDVAMPEVTGIELAARLGDVRADVPVLFISGFVEKVREGPVGLPPGAAFLAKPFAPTALAAKVRAVLDRARPA